MNILPKKKWHVRTKENIARVRRDEAEAAAQAKEIEVRAKLAEQEARTSLLRTKARLRVQKDCPELPEELKLAVATESTSGDSSAVVAVVAATELKHVNFFEDLESGETTAAANKEHEAEKKHEQEEYEKKVGYLTYLGQDSQELTGEKTWWEKLPLDRGKVDDSKAEASSSSKTSELKNFLDPLNSVRKYLGCEGVKRIASQEMKKVDEKKRKRKRKRSSSSSGEDNRKSRKKHKREKKKKKKKKMKKRKEESDSSEVDTQEEERQKAEKKAMIDKLRLERIERERRERERTDKLLYGETKTKKSEEEKQEDRLKETRKYNNQFNPEAARQNKLDSNKKYWLE